MEVFAPSRSEHTPVMVVMQECGLLQGNPFSCCESQLLGSLLHCIWHGERNDGANKNRYVKLLAAVPGSLYYRAYQLYIPSYGNNACAGHVLANLGDTATRIMRKRKATAASRSAAPKKQARASDVVRPQILLLHHSAHHPQGSKHPAMQTWAKALAAVGDVHDSIVFPKPFNLMPRLVGTLETALAAAAGPGCKRRVLLVGVGMGARVAAHLLSGASGDDGKPLPPVAANLKAKVTGCVCVDYPLLRVGSREVRAQPLLAMPADGPPLLFVHGAMDKHMDRAKLPIKRIKPAVHVFNVGGKSCSPSEEDMAAAVKRIALVGAK